MVYNNIDNVGKRKTDKSWESEGPETKGPGWRGLSQQGLSQRTGPENFAKGAAWAKGIGILHFLPAYVLSFLWILQKYMFSM